MYNNYLYLLRGISELRSKVLNSEVIDIFTQEKDKLFIRIPTINHPDFTLILSNNAQQPYFSFKNEIKKAKKNTRDFFAEYLPSRLVDISIASNDRVIEFTLTRAKFYFLIRGARSNVVLIAGTESHSFKKIDTQEVNEIKSEILKTGFLNPSDSLVRIKNDIGSLSLDEIISKYRFINYLLNRIDVQSGDDWRSKLLKMIDDILSKEIAVTIPDETGEFDFIPSTFVSSNLKQKQYFYDDYFSALNKFLISKSLIKRDFNTKKELEKYLRKEIDKIFNKLNDLKARLEVGSRENEFSYLANLLLININKIRKGHDSITVRDELGKQDVTITIDKSLSPNQNVDKLFEKAKSEKINYQKSSSLYSDLELKYKKLSGLLGRLTALEDHNEILLLKKELGIKSNMELKTEEPGINFRRFLIDKKYHLYVGKNSKNNDELTTRFAKQNDLWFHARSVSGSHVVLRVENTKEPVPKNIIKKAASIAAFYSKAKTSKLVSVSYTFKKYVNKRKSLDQGQVILLREQTILVPPEIPEGCESID